MAAMAIGWVEGNWLTELGELKRGKYKGDMIGNVAEDDEDYCHWMLETVNLTTDEEAAIEEALGL